MSLPLPVEQGQSAHPARPGRGADALAATVLLILSLGFFAPLFSPLLGARHFLAPGDFSEQFYPFRAFAAQEWWQLRVPLWNPHVLAGHPFLADPQTAVLYPPSLLTVLLFGRDGLPFEAIEFEMAMHYPLAGLFAYLLARRIMLRPAAALLAALVYEFGGYLTSYPMLQLPVLETAAWFPLVLYLIEAGAASERPLPHWAGAGLALGLSLLAGHGQTALYVAYAVAGYLLWRGRLARHAWRSLAAGLALFFLLAAGLAAAQLLPTLEFVAQSNRARIGLAEAGHGYEPQALLALLLPRWRGELAPYVGIAPLVLALVAVAARPDPRIRFWAGLALAAAVLSLGARTPLFALLYHLAPGFNLFRDQERVMVLFSLSLALLAGHGLDHLLGLDGTGRRDLLRTVGRGLALVALLAGLAWLVVEAARRADWLDPALAGVALDLPPLILALLALLLWTALARRPASVGAGLVALLLGLAALDLFALSWGRNFVAQDPDPRPALAPIAARIRADVGEPFRVRAANEATFPSNYAPLLGLPTVTGNTPIVNERTRVLLERADEWRLWQLLNVKYQLARHQQPPPGLEPLPGTDAAFRVQYSLPRAWAVRDARIASGPEDALRETLDPALHPGDTVVLEQPPAVGALAPGLRPDVVVEEYGPQRVVIRASADGPAILVLADSYYPGWRAWRDGTEVPIYRANYALRALDLPTGAHRFVLVYDPLSFKLGLAISAVTLASALLLLLAERIRARLGRLTG